MVLAFQRADLAGMAMNNAAAAMVDLSFIMLPLLLPQLRLNDLQRRPSSRSGTIVILDGRPFFLQNDRHVSKPDRRTP